MTKINKKFITFCPKISFSCAWTMNYFMHCSCFIDFMEFFRPNLFQFEKFHPQKQRMDSINSIIVFDSC